MIQRSLAGIVRLLTGVPAYPVSMLPKNATIYFANHTSHLDFLTIWAALPYSIRRRTHPVAAKDYWSKNRLRSWLATSIFQAHLIDRRHSSKNNHPLDPLSELLEAGESIIIFPEGTRSRDGRFGSFKSGIFHLAQRHSHLPLVPVFLENLNRILPAGEFLPIPLLGHISIRPPIYINANESKAEFIQRAELAVQETYQHK